MKHNLTFFSHKENIYLIPGIYIHVPFCRKRCSYCDFYLTTNMKITGTFTESLLREAGIYSKMYGEEAFNSIFFGGGTPSALKYEETERILNILRNEFNISEKSEITMECNPEDVTEEPDKFMQLAKLGINRISLGIQSFIDSELKYLTREHDSATAENAVKIAKDIFQNVSVDIIYALHDQKLQDIKYNVAKVIELDVQHVSAYTLILEKGSLMHKQMEKTEKIELAGMKAEEYYGAITEMLKNAGFRHYEVSNYAKPGYESRHNLKYWNYEDYLGLGPSAHSFMKGRRFSNFSSLKKYNEMLKENVLPLETDEIPERKQMMNDYFVSVFRSEGVDFEHYDKLFGEDFLEKHKTQCEELCRLGFAAIHPARFSLTEKGFALADEITLKFLK